ncbi:hypothetical protein EVAR_20741_1 [Eumeta japonica]|uniref:Uncharacterized protein n=1 Tax=Eumeta variegata TaxID=151549 RepID=A0A4C1V8Z8_EUMVA|nr:hypothetical protein EVAR_20741_1 [Eumeta japonica]
MFSRDLTTLHGDWLDVAVSVRPSVYPSVRTKCEDHPGAAVDALTTRVVTSLFMDPYRQYTNERSAEKVRLFVRAVTAARAAAPRYRSPHARAVTCCAFGLRGLRV